MIDIDGGGVSGGIGGRESFFHIGIFSEDGGGGGGGTGGSLTVNVDLLGPTATAEDLGLAVGSRSSSWSLDG